MTKKSPSMACDPSPATRLFSRLPSLFASFGSFGRVEVKAAGENRQFVQLWAVALVFVLFATLFFIMAMMDLERLENMLLEHRIRKAQYVTEGIEKASSDWFDRMALVDGYGATPPGVAVRDGASPPSGSAAASLIDLARSIAARERTISSTLETLRGTAESEHLAGIAILDENGRAALHTGVPQRTAESRSKALMEGREGTSIQLAVESDKPDSYAFVGMRSEGGTGAVALFLDAKGLHYWRLKASIQKAVEELRWVRGVSYLEVEDGRGAPITEAGPAPGLKSGTGASSADIPYNPKELQAPVAKEIDTHSVEIALPFRLPDGAIGRARVDLETHADQFVIQNRWHIFFWTGIMILIGLFAMGLLYQTQNRHVAKLQAIREKLHHAERLSSLAKLAAGVAHEIRNPLNAVSMATQRLQREFGPEEGEKRREFERITFIVRDEIRRLNGIIEDFLSLSRTDRLDVQPQPIMHLLKRVAFLVREEAVGRGVRLEEIETDFSPNVLMDGGKMEQALLNIVRNAVESISGEGVVTVGVEDSGKSMTSVLVRDTGAGIPREEAGRIFDPYYTTKEKGIGIGLCIAHEIVIAHGGEIRVKSEPGKGTTFEILLPREEA